MTEEPLFHEALAKPPAERDAFLDRACSGQPELRARIDKLLKAHAQADDFLADKTSDLTADDASAKPQDAGLGRQIGPYKLLQQLGEGGMGVVYMAEQTEPVQRKVALKIIKPGMDSTQVLARFNAERQALALMDHPNIAKVLDAGATDSGRPFFVMELVKGIPITKYCDQQRLTPRERLELLIPVCQAVQHAHQKGIIHRDLKPSNVLIALYDGRPVPKVIDFGVAKATNQKLTEATLFTQVGQIVGTLEYMAPEQAELNNLDVDTRADIYSLGVILYELLTGSPPFTGKQLRSAAFTEMLRMIREVEPPKPSTRLSSSEELPTIAANRKLEPKRLASLISGDLDWIAMKALDKDRGRRYETANGLAIDLQHYLADEPVQAGPPSATYRFRKFVKRNKIRVAVAGLLLATLVAGMIGTTIGLLRAEKARNEEAEQRTIAQARQQEAEDEKKRAIEFRDKALDALRAMTGSDVEKLIGAKKEIGPNERAYLEAIIKRWQAFADGIGDDETSRTVRAEGLAQVGYLWRRLGEFERARAQIRAALEVQIRLADQFPDHPGYQRELALSHSNLGAVLLDLGKWREAEEEQILAREIRKRLVERFPDVDRFREDLASSHNNLAVLFTHLVKGEQAREEFRAALELRQALAAKSPDAPALQQELGASHNNFAVLLAEHGLADDARREYLAAREIRARLASRFPNQPDYRVDLAATRRNLANLLSAQARVSEAREEFQASIDLMKKLAEQYPAKPEYRQDLAAAHNSLGNLYRNAGDLETARKEFLAAIEIQKPLAEQFPNVPRYHLELAGTHANLGNVLGDLNKPAEAKREYLAAIKIQQELVDRVPEVPMHRQELARSHNSLANLLSDLGQYDEARAEYRPGREILQQLVAQFPNVPDYQLDLGCHYCNFGLFLLENEKKPAESLEWFNLAIPMLTAIYHKQNRDAFLKQVLCNSHRGRAKANQMLQKFADALKDLDQVIELARPAERADARGNRAYCLMAAGKLAEAIIEVNELSKSGDWSAEHVYNFACVYAVASGKIAGKQKEYADRAMELLQKATKAGFQDAAQFAKDKDLDPLRGRDDFKSMIRELEKKSTPKK